MRASRGLLRYDHNVGDPLDAALASETLRLCARDDFAVAGAVGPRRRAAEEAFIEARAHRPRAAARTAPKLLPATMICGAARDTKDALEREFVGSRAGFERHHIARGALAKPVRPEERIPPVENDRVGVDIVPRPGTAERAAMERKG